MEVELSAGHGLSFINCALQVCDLERKSLLMCVRRRT